MKYKTTRKAVVNGSVNVKCAGYCDLQGRFVTASRGISDEIRKENRIHLRRLCGRCRALERLTQEKPRELCRGKIKAAHAGRLCFICSVLIPHSIQQTEKLKCKVKSILFTPLYHGKTLVCCRGAVGGENVGVVRFYALTIKSGACLLRRRNLNTISLNPLNISHYSCPPSSISLIRLIIASQSDLEITVNPCVCTAMLAIISSLLGSASLSFLRTAFRPLICKAVALPSLAVKSSLTACLC